MYFKRHQLILLAKLSTFGPTKHRTNFFLCQLKMQVLCVSTWTVKLLISIRKNNYDKRKEKKKRRCTTGNSLPGRRGLQNRIMMAKVLQPMRLKLKIKALSLGTNFLGYRTSLVKQKWQFSIYKYVIRSILSQAPYVQHYFSAFT